jgi:hypothetical protein
MTQEHNPPAERMHQQAQLEAAHGLVEGLIEAVLLLQQCSVDEIAPALSAAKPEVVSRSRSRIGSRRIGSL